MTALCSLFLCLSLSVSAYSDTGPTRWGGNAVPAQHGVAACGPSWAPGSIVYVPGLGARVCMDTGGLVTDGHIDIWFADEDAAWQWGRRRMTVVVMR